MRNIFTLLGVCAASTYVLAQTGLPAKLHDFVAQTQPSLAVATAVPQAQAAVAAAQPSAAAGQVDPNSRISSDLQELYQQAHSTTASKRTAKALQTSFPQLLLAADAEMVTVRITAQDVTALLPLLEARGFVVASEKAKFHFVEGLLPLEQLAPGKQGVSALEAQGLLGVLPVYAPVTNAGKILNQADFVLEASRVRASAGGYNGTGVRIGVMSDSYNALGGAAAGVTADELPANVQVLQDPTTGTDEGRAMIELIHDVAPGAGVAFSGIYLGEANFADQIYRLADPTVGNCKILVDDISYLNEPMFQDGVTAQAVEEVIATRGVAYYSSAGNYADKSSEYVSPTFTATTGGAADLDFGLSTGATTDTRQPFTIPASGAFRLAIQWSDPFYTSNGVKTDLDAYLVIARTGAAQKGDTVARAVTNNIASQTPGEIISFTNGATSTTTAYNLILNRRAGTADPARVKYIGYGAAFTPTKYWTRSGTVTGHHASANTMSVSAAASFDRLNPESFTSKGQPVYLFGPLGAPLAAPVTRQKPDFTSIDAASTSFFGQNLTAGDPSFGYLFSGTSAAAPNAAAVAALLWQAQPTLTQAQLNTQLKATATDLLTAGYDDLTGAGLINAYAAIYGLPQAATAPFTETFENGGLSRAWQIEGRAGGRSLVRTDLAPASAPGQLVLDNFFAGYTIGVGTSEATLRLNLSAAAGNGYTLSFKHKKILNEVDEAMPATFTTTSPTDGVALSVDGGTNWYRLTDLTGTNATTDYKTVTVNLTQFAATNNLTLGADTRIRFQRYGSGRQVDVTAAARRGGRAFDDITVTSGAAAPVAAFTSSATTAAICPGTTVQFTDNSLLSPTSWSWSFPGGTPATSTAQNPTVTYNTAGTYNVTLTVTNAAGSSTRTTNSVVTVSNAVPVANFRVRQAPICPGGKIAFANTSTQCASSISWTFPGGTPAASTDQNPVVTYAAAGTYTATLTATNANGSSTKTYTVQVQGAPTAIPYTETLASGIPSTWGVLNPDNSTTWATAANVLRRDGTRGTVVDMNFFDYAAQNQRDTLQTPALNLQNQSQAYLYFDLAYAPVANVPSANNDSLSVEVYTACSNTRLGRVYLKSALNGLPTTLFRGSSYAPTAASQWRLEMVDLSAYLGKQIYLRFVAYNQYGNHLYLANVRVSNTVLATKSAIADSPALQAFPNPVAGGERLTLTLPTVAGSASLRLVDALGRTTWQHTLTLSAATATTYTLAPTLATGIYTVLCQTADGQLYSRRVVVE